MKQEKRKEEAKKGKERIQILKNKVLNNCKEKEKDCR
jgi:hypothetical protein